MSRLAQQEDDWRRKYFDSLRAIEEEARRYRDDQKILQQLITRLCAAAQGQSPLLDAVLKSLRDALRREAPGEELVPLSEAVSDAIRDMDDPEQDTASTISQRLRSLVAPREPQAHADPARRSPTAALPLLTPLSAEESMRSVLSRMVDEVRVEPLLKEAAADINRQLRVPLVMEQLPALVERVGGLLVLRMRELDKARRGLELLLSQLIRQLDALNEHIAGTQEEETRRKSSDTLDLQISGEVRALTVSVDTGLDLSLVRRQVRDRLNSINQHLQNFQAREEERARQSRERTMMMRVRMEEMETEAKSLQARLSDEKRLSLLDTLTQIPNRLAWEQRMVDEAERWKRFRQPTCIAAWDIDEFKLINDRFGHKAGDKVLCVVAETLASGLRGSDFVARYGGEEFVMLLPGTPLVDGVRLVDKLREAIARTGFHFRGAPVSVSISCGITLIQEGDGENEAFDRADKAMYRAKEAGRNRVVSV
ncbi:MAG: GGDEF domain-containing protein [Steroidobacteraceae bacterium]